MNNFPSNNAPAIIRSLIIYAMCVPLAVTMGYLLTNPLDYSTGIIYGVLVLVLILPLLLRWHYQIMLAVWNVPAVVFILKGSPNLGLVMICMSLVISVLERILIPDRQFVRVPQITWPVLAIFAVVVFTAKLTGGMGFHALGSDVYGGKKYMLTFGAIFGYFAITARRIPLDQAKMALALFFLGGLTAGIADTYVVAPSAFTILYRIFPPSAYYEGVELGVTRLTSAQGVSTAVVTYMLARYGIRGIFNSSRLWRLPLFFLFLAYGLLGGYRGVYIMLLGTFAIQFVLEGMHRTKLLPIFAVIGILVTIVTIPMISKLPFTVQRTLAFLPLPVSPEAKMSGEATVDWRRQMWEGLLPQIPKYLLLGKGYAISKDEFGVISGAGFRETDVSEGKLAMSSDYHSGWITVLIAFGIWGMLAFLWFALASIWVLARNYQYGHPGFQTVNCFLLANFIMRFLIFMTFGGSGFHVDLIVFVSVVGLSIVFNNGMCRKKVPAATEPRVIRPVRPFPQLRPGFQR